MTIKVLENERQDRDRRRAQWAVHRTRWARYLKTCLRYRTVYLEAWRPLKLRDVTRNLVDVKGDDSDDDTYEGLPVTLLSVEEDPEDENLLVLEVTCPVCDDGSTKYDMSHMNEYDLDHETERVVEFCTKCGDDADKHHEQESLVLSSKHLLRSAKLKCPDESLPTRE